MSLHRTPPSGNVISASGSGGGSTPNLSTKYSEEEERAYSKKRKERGFEHEFKEDLADFRKEMMSFFREFANTQNEKFESNSP